LLSAEGEEEEPWEEEAEEEDMEGTADHDISSAEANAAESKPAKSEVMSTVELPELTTESYDEDPEVGLQRPTLLKLGFIMKCTFQFVYACLTDRARGVFVFQREIKLKQLLECRPTATAQRRYLIATS